MHALLSVIYQALELYKFVVIGAAVMSWFIAFNVVNVRNELVRSVWNLFDALTTPLLRPIRKFLPNMGGIDISPVILLLIVLFVQYLIEDLLRAYPFAF